MTETLRQVFVNVSLDSTLSSDFEPCSYIPSSTITSNSNGRPNTSPVDSFSSNSESKKVTNKTKSKKRISVTTTQENGSDNSDSNFQRAPTTMHKGDHEKAITFERYELRMCNTNNTVADIKRLLVADKDDTNQSDLDIVKKAEAENPNAGLVLLTQHPNAVLVLKYNGDIMDDSEKLSSYGVNSNVYGYVEFDLVIYNNHGAPNRINSIVIGHDIQQQLGTTATQNAIWEPLPREAVHWSLQPGPPVLKSYLLHAVRCGGSKGVLRILDHWKEHAGNVESALWSLLILGSRSRSGIAYRNRLVNQDGVLKYLIVSIEKHPEHLGVQKQVAGVLHYLTKGSKSRPASCDICIAIINKQFIIVLFKALKWSNANLRSLTKAERVGARGSCFGDLVEYVCSTLRNLVVGLNDPLYATERWRLEDDNTEKAEERKRLQKEIKKQMKNGERLNHISKAKEYIVGCSFEKTASFAVESLLNILKIEK